MLLALAHPTRHQNGEEVHQRLAVGGADPRLRMHPGIGGQGHLTLLQHLHRFLGLVPLPLGTSPSPCAHVELGTPLVDVVLHPEVHRCDVAVPGIGGMVAVAVVTGVVQEVLHRRRRCGDGDEVMLRIVRLYRPVRLEHLRHQRQTGQDRSFPGHRFSISSTMAMAALLAGPAAPKVLPVV